MKFKLFTILAMLLFAIPAFSTPQLLVEVGDDIYGASETFSVYVKLDAVDAPVENFGAFQLQLAFDKDNFQAQSVELGDWLASTQRIPTHNYEEGDTLNIDIPDNDEGYYYFGTATLPNDLVGGEGNTPDGPTLNPEDNAQILAKFTFSFVDPALMGSFAFELVKDDASAKATRLADIQGEEITVTPENIINDGGIVNIGKLNLTALLHGYPDGATDPLEISLRTGLNESDMYHLGLVQPNVAGSAPIRVPQGAFHVVIDHLNHLSVISNNAYNFTIDTATPIDFTSDDVAYGNDPLYNENGVMKLRGGDADENEAVAFSDLGAWLPANGSVPGDAAWNDFADFNGDDAIAFNDLSIWLASNGYSSEVSGGSRLLNSPSKELDEYEDILAYSKTLSAESRNSRTAVRSKNKSGTLNPSKMVSGSRDGEFNYYFEALNQMAPGDTFEVNVVVDLNDQMAVSVNSIQFHIFYDTDIFETPVIVDYLAPAPWVNEVNPAFQAAGRTAVRYEHGTFPGAAAYTWDDEIVPFMLKFPVKEDAPGGITSLEWRGDPYSNINDMMVQTYPAITTDGEFGIPMPIIEVVDGILGTPFTSWDVTIGPGEQGSVFPPFIYIKNVWDGPGDAPLYFDIEGTCISNCGQGRNEASSKISKTMESLPLKASLVSSKELKTLSKSRSALAQSKGKDAPISISKTSTKQGVASKNMQLPTREDVADTLGWLAWNPDNNLSSGGIPAGGFDVMILEILDTSMMGNGVYQTEITITSNDSVANGLPNLVDEETKIMVTLTIQAPEIIVSPYPLDFETITVDETKELAVTIGNSANADGTLEVTAISSDTTAFALSSRVALYELAPGETVDVPVIFSPVEGPGEYLGALTIESNDPGTPSYELTMMGNAICNSVASITPDTPIDLELEAYDPAVDQVFTITNESGPGCDLDIVNIKFIADNDAPPVTFSETAVTIPEGETYDITATFYGETEGAWTGYIFLYDGNGKITTDSLETTVVVTPYAEIQITDIPDQELLIENSVSFDLDNYTVIDPDHVLEDVNWTASIVGAPRSLTSKTSQSSSKKVAARATSKVQNASREVMEYGDNELSIQIDSATHMITFANTEAMPNWFGTKTVMVTAHGPKFDMNANDTADQQFMVSINAPDIMVPSSHDYGLVFADETPVWTVTIENVQDGTLDGNLIINDIASSDDVHFVVEALTYPITVAPGTTQDVDVTFVPGGVVDSWTGVITIDSNDPDGDTLIDVQGSAQCRPVIVVDDTPIDINLEQDVDDPGTTEIVNIANTNGCGGILTVNNVYLDTAFEQISLTLPEGTAFPLTLIDGASIDATLTFATQPNPITEAGNLVIESDDENNLTIQVPVSLTVTGYVDIVLGLPDPFTFEEDEENENARTITLDNYVVMDPEHFPNEVIWNDTPVITPGGGELTVEITDDRKAIFTTEENWDGSKQVTFSATGPGGEVVTQTIEVDATPVNDAPVFSSVIGHWYMSYVNNEEFTEIMTVFDPDDDVTFTSQWVNSNPVSGFVFDDTTPNQVSISFTPAEADSGDHLLMVTADDGVNAPINEFVNIHILGDVVPCFSWIEQSWQQGIIVQEGGTTDAEFTIAEGCGGRLVDASFFAGNFYSANEAVPVLPGDYFSFDTEVDLSEVTGYDEIPVTITAPSIGGLDEITSFHGLVYIQGQTQGSQGQDSTYTAILNPVYEVATGILDTLEIMVTVYPADMPIPDYEYETVDFNDDVCVTSIDVLFFAHHYGASIGDENWDEEYDVGRFNNGHQEFGPDGVVNLHDLGFVSVYYGQCLDVVLAEAPPAHSKTMASLPSKLSVDLDNSNYNEIEKTFSIDVIGEAQNFRGSEIEIYYNPQVAQFVSAREGDLMDADGRQTFFVHDNDAEKGILTLTLSTMGSVIQEEESGVLATLEFEAAKEAQISIGNVIATDANLQSASVTKGESQKIASENDGYEVDAPKAFGLSQNFPNPFNPTTNINFQTPYKTDVVINIYNSNGHLVKELINEEREAGYHTVLWDGTDDNSTPVPSGLYIYTMDSEGFHQKQQMMLLK